MRLKAPSKAPLLEGGNLVEAYCSGDVGDRIPFDRVELFLARSMIAIAGAKGGAPCAVADARV